jgi:hypothetical protein
MDTISSVRMPVISGDEIKHLIMKGYVIIDGVDPDIVEKSIELPQVFAGLLKRWDVSHWNKLTFEREKRPDGKYDPDDGFIASGGGVTDAAIVKDSKYRFHYRPTLKDIIAESGRDIYRGFMLEVHPFMDVCAEVFAYRAQVYEEIMLQMSLYDMHLAHLPREVKENRERPGATSRSVLRVLYYAPRPVGEMARDHFDRSCITISGPQMGGEFFIRMSDGSEKVVSTTPGQLLIMLGEKARMMTLHNRIKLLPIAHGVRTRTAHEERFALVSFHHVNLELWDAPFPLY